MLVDSVFLFRHIIVMHDCSQPIYQNTTLIKSFVFYLRSKWNGKFEQTVKIGICTLKMMLKNEQQPQFVIKLLLNVSRKTTCKRYSIIIHHQTSQLPRATYINLTCYRNVYNGKIQIKRRKNIKMDQTKFRDEILSDYKNHRTSLLK